MNSLVASVIRTYTPIIVGQLAAWLIMIHIPVRPELEVLLTALVGAILSASYYTLVRILEQQWPWFGALLGLTASPDTYSKGDPALQGTQNADGSHVITSLPGAAAPTDIATPAAAEPAPIDVKITLPETAPAPSVAPAETPALAAPVAAPTVA